MSKGIRYVTTLGGYRRPAVLPFPAEQAAAVAAFSLVTTGHAPDAQANPFSSLNDYPGKPASQHYGDVMQFGIPLGALAITIGKEDYIGTRQLLTSCAITLGTTAALKKVFNNTPLGQRPNGGKYSFPSGHTAAAMCGASFLQQRYGSSYGTPAYTLAAGVGYSRVVNDKHHWHDVIGAALVSEIVVRQTVRPLASAPVYQRYAPERPHQELWLGIGRDSVGKPMPMLRYNLTF